jgi:hypothetical protein
LGEEFFAKATLRMPHSAVAVPLDAEILGWFQAQGEGAERHMAESQQQNPTKPELALGSTALPPTHFLKIAKSG